MKDELNIKALESCTDELILMVNRLRDENLALRQQQSTLLAERGKLMEKTELARSRVEMMIQRIRTMEKN